jgi:arylsulfatase A-like enzyme
MDRPHIILFITDNHPVDQIGCMTRGSVRTPTFDRIGNEGVIMTHTRTPSPVCTPARAALFTGMQPHRAGLPTVDLSWKDQWGVEPAEQAFQVPPITDPLREAGYQCLYAGKWHVGETNMKNAFDRCVANDEGFEDYMAWCREQGVPNGFIFRDPDRGKPFRFHEFPHMVQPHAAPLDIPPEMEHNRWMLNHAVDMLRTHEPGKPTFMVFSTYGPHPPLAIPEPYYSMYDPESLSAPPDWGPPPEEPDFYRDCYYRRMFRHKGESFEAWRKSLAVSNGYATYIDSLFGEFVQTLETEGIADNTLLIMASDHGDMMGRRGLWRIFCPYEPTLRVPWLMRWPGVIPGGTFYDRPTTLPDVGATILHAAGLDPASLDLDGRSVLHAEEVSGARDIFSEFTQPAAWHEWLGIEDWRCIVRHPWKLIVYAGGDAELFNLRDDPHEQKNLAGAPESEMLLRALIEESAESGDPFPYRVVEIEQKATKRTEKSC